MAAVGVVMSPDEPFDLWAEVDAMMAKKPIKKPLPKPELELRVVCKCENLYVSKEISGPFQCPECTLLQTGGKITKNYRVRRLGAGDYSSFIYPTSALQHLEALEKSYPNDDFMIMEIAVQQVHLGHSKYFNPLVYRILSKEALTKLADVPGLGVDYAVYKFYATSSTMTAYVV
jgi:hypothetical protein